MGSTSTIRRKQLLLRKKLTERGLPPHRIEKILATELKRRLQKQEDDANREALAEAERRCEEENRQRGIDREAREQQNRIDEFYEQEGRRFDDAKFKPTQVDSVLRGQARATGATAVAVKRRKTLTQYEYQQRERR